MRTVVTAMVDMVLAAPVVVVFVVSFHIFTGGMIPIDEGTARLPRRTILSRTTSGRLLRNLSLGQALRVMCGPHGMPDKGIDRRFDEMVDFAEAAGHLHLPIEATPRQVIQQVDFTMSVFVPADLYTFDRTAFVGSPAFRQKCGLRLRDMAARGKGAS